MIGLSFASPSTILPAFGSFLGASNVLIGAMPAVMTLGWFLPSLFAARHTRALSRKLPFVLRWTAGERVPFLVLALVAFTLAKWAPTLTLVVVFAMLLVITGTGGALIPAWMDIVGRCIPGHVRGRFFGTSNLIASACGFAGSSVLLPWILGSVAAPASYGVCFLIATGFMGLSWVALAATREPPGPAAEEPLPLRAFLRRMGVVVREDRNLRWLMIGRGCNVLGGMATAFFTVHALRSLDAPLWRVGVFTSAVLAGQVLGFAVLGWLADRVGHRVVLIVGAASMMGANVMALATSSLDLYLLTFVLAGIDQAAANVSAQTVMLEFAPTAVERPTYVGLANTALAPVFFGAPLAAGVLADALGFRLVFGLASAFGVLAVTLLVSRVRDPRTLAPVL